MGKENAHTPSALHLVVATAPPDDHGTGVRVLVDAVGYDASVPRCVRRIAARFSEPPRHRAEAAAAAVTHVLEDEAPKPAECIVWCEDARLAAALSDDDEPPGLRPDLRRRLDAALASAGARTLDPGKVPGRGRSRARELARRLRDPSDDLADRELLDVDAR